MRSAAEDGVRVCARARLKATVAWLWMGQGSLLVRAEIASSPRFPLGYLPPSVVLMNDQSRHPGAPRGLSAGSCAAGPGLALT